MGDRAVTYLNLSALSRRELENLILTTHGALRRVLEAVREHTEETWAVRREVERIVAEHVDQRPFRVAFRRAVATDSDRREALQNEERWRRYGP
jgi:hypothetical protein